MLAFLEHLDIQSWEGWKCQNPNFSLFSDAFRFWRFQVPRDSDTFQFDSSKFWHIPVMGDSDTFFNFCVCNTFIFWHIQALKYFRNLRFWHVPVSEDSDTFRFWHFQILTHLDSDTKDWIKNWFWHFHVSPTSSLLISQPLPAEPALLYN